MAAWEALQRGEGNPLIESLSGDERITAYLPPGRVRELLKARSYVGDAPGRCRGFLRLLRRAIKEKAAG